MDGNEDEGWWTWWNFYWSNSQALLGHWDNGAHYSGRGIEQGAASSTIWGKVCCEMIHGICKFWMGDPRNGLETYERGLRHHLEISGAQVLSWWHGIFAELLAVAGNAQEAVRHLNECSGSVGRGDMAGLPFVFRATALVATMKDEYGDATSEFHKGIEFAKQRQLLPEMSVTQLRYAECLHRKGDVAAALEQLGEAEKLFDDMGMTWWGTQAIGLRARIANGKPFVWFAPYVDGLPQV
jgi:hypothetical protein